MVSCGDEDGEVKANDGPENVDADVAGDDEEAEDGVGDAMEEEELMEEGETKAKEEVGATCVWLPLFPPALRSVCRELLSLSLDEDEPKEEALLPAILLKLFVPLSLLLLVFTLEAAAEEEEEADDDDDDEAVVVAV